MTDDEFRTMLDGVKRANQGRANTRAGLEHDWRVRTDLNAQLAELRESVARLRETLATLQTMTGRR